MRIDSLARSVATVWQVVKRKNARIMGYAVSLFLVAILVNVVIMGFATGRFPKVRVNDGTTVRIEPEQGDPIETVLSVIIPFWDSFGNYPLMWFEFTKDVVALDDSGRQVTASWYRGFYITYRYLLDTMLVVVPASVYLTMTREYSKALRQRLAGVSIASLTSTPPTATSVLTSYSAVTTCCGPAVTETGLYILGVVVTSATTVLLSAILTFAVATAFAFIALLKAHRYSSMRCNL